MASDADLEKQAQDMAEKALPATLPPAVREAKLPAVRQKILERLKAQRGDGQQVVVSRPAAPVRPLWTPPPGASGLPPASLGEAPPPPPPPPEDRERQEREQVLKIDGVELCGDEKWFADTAVRRQLRETVAEAHKEQKILVGAPEDEVRRICPQDGRVLGAGAVLRLGGAHLGGYGESDVAYAYRQLSRALHPDKNPDLAEAPSAFLRLREASDELRQSLNEQRVVLQQFIAAMGGRSTPEMIERPQEALFAEASRLLMAVCNAAGEGKVSNPAQFRGASAFARSSSFHSCQQQALLREWFDQSRLLELYGSPAFRAAYDCAPKRHRAQLLCLLNRAVVVEAVRCGDCVRGNWSTILQAFPELVLWRSFRDRIKQRVWHLTPAEAAEFAKLDAAEAVKAAEALAAAAKGAPAQSGQDRRADSRDRRRRERSRSRRRRRSRSQRRYDEPGGGSNGLRRGERQDPYRERERKRSAEWESRWVKCDDQQNLNNAIEGAAVDPGDRAAPSRRSRQDVRKAIATHPDTGQHAGRWARKWRATIASILPSGFDSAVSPTDCEVRKLSAALWRDIAAWVETSEAGSEAGRGLGLFRGDHQTSRTFGWDIKDDSRSAGSNASADWCFVPASDIILILADGIVGMTAEGIFADTPAGHRRRSFADCFKKPGAKPRKRNSEREKAINKETDVTKPRISKWDM